MANGKSLFRFLKQREREREREIYPIPSKNISVQHTSMPSQKYFALQQYGITSQRIECQETNSPFARFVTLKNIYISFFLILSSSLSFGYPRLSTPWIGVLLDEGYCFLLK